MTTVLCCRGKFEERVRINLLLLRLLFQRSFPLQIVWRFWVSQKTLTYFEYVEEPCRGITAVAEDIPSSFKQILVFKDRYQIFLDHEDSRDLQLVPVINWEFFKRYRKRNEECFYITYFLDGRRQLTHWHSGKDHHFPFSA